MQPPSDHRQGSEATVRQASGLPERLKALAAKERDIGLCLFVAFIAAALLALPLYSFLQLVLTGALPGISVAGRSLTPYGPAMGNSHFGEFSVSPGSFAFFKHVLLYSIMLLLGLVMLRAGCAMCLRMASMPRFDRLLPPLVLLLKALVVLLAVSLVAGYIYAKLV